MNREIKLRSKRVDNDIKEFDGKWWFLKPDGTKDRMLSDDESADHIWEVIGNVHTEKGHQEAVERVKEQQ